MLDRNYVRSKLLNSTLRFILAAEITTGLAAGAWPASAQTTGPYKLHTTRELILSAAGASMVLAGFAVEAGQGALSPADIEALDAADINAFDRPATEQWSPDAGTASDILTFSLLASPVILAASEIKSGPAATLAVMYGETLLLKNGIIQLLKGATSRTRPFVYNDDPAVPEEEKLTTSARRSFPSGHTANAFAAAVFLGTTYSRLHPDSGARGWVWAGALTAAGTVGYLRYRAGRHFTTDVLAGALIGSSIGYLVPKLHETDSVDIAPSAGGLRLGMNLSF